MNLEPLSPRPFASRHLLMLLAVVAAGLALRVYGLGDSSIWLDEGYSIRVAQMDVGAIVGECMAKDNSPPLYYLALHFWMRAFGDSEFAVRFLSVVFGTLTILVVYRIGRLMFDPETGIMAAMLLAASLFHVRYSQEARCFAMLGLASAASFYVLLKMAQGGSWRTGVAYLVCAVAMLYTHVFGFLTLLAENLVAAMVLFRRRGDGFLTWRRWAILQIATLAAYLPCAGMLLRQTSGYEGQGVYWVPVPSLLSLADTIREYAGAYYSREEPWAPVLFIVAAVLSLIVVDVRGLRLRSRRFGAIACSPRGFWFPLIAAFTLSRISSPIYLTKYTLGSSLAIYVLAGRGITNVGPGHLRGVFAAAVVAASLAGLGGYYHEGFKERWRDAVGDLEAEAKPGDVVVINAAYCLDNAYAYYARRRDLVLAPAPREAPIALRTVFDERVVPDVVRAVWDRRRFWLILSHADYRRPLTWLTKAMGKGYRIVRNREYVGDITVMLFER